jgi:hypothetical protein
MCGARLAVRSLPRIGTAGPTPPLRHDLIDIQRAMLQPSPNHGIGVFAIRDIPKGRNPFRTCLT